MAYTPRLDEAADVKAAAALQKQFAEQSEIEKLKARVEELENNKPSWNDVGMHD